MFMTAFLIVALAVTAVYLWLLAYDHFARARQDIINQKLKRDMTSDAQLRKEHQDKIHKFLLEDNEDA